MDVPGTYDGFLSMAKQRAAGGATEADTADLALRMFFAEAEQKFEEGVYTFIWKVRRVVQ